jgi:hypothetical protein
MNMLRVYIRSVIEKRGLPPPDASTLEESMEVLRCLSLAAASLTRMARTQKYLDGTGPDSIEGFSEMLAEVNAKLRKEGVH